MNWNPDEHYKSRTVAVDYDASRFSSIPGRVFNFLEKRTVARCFSRLSKGSTIADAPCGTGRLAEALLEAGYSVHGFDISEAMLSVARQRLVSYAGTFTCEVADMKKDPPSGPICDGALCARVLMHFPLDGQIEFLTAVASLSSSIVVINQSLDSGYQRFRRRLKRLMGHQPPANYPISNRDIRLLLEKSGLREVGRQRLLPLVSEAVYIVAEKV
ncbi:MULTISPECIES: methyltransferase domain-containing protein [Rhodanobacter]|uniref:methyltransferase domain-containing protein n=1 Tax=Rhodanobacter TaxID=75309 RepID=UPI0004885CB8|nr:MULTISPECIES: methyltransferase domain-containing protein [Rhodanobacter]TAN16809.1 MAG: methyltransferase domain-containing protein [Rhodanobacter sp.]UJJ54314.1 methyltransferase domain-containing protein [Rhodanobacter thiooxydans]